MLGDVCRRWAWVRQTPPRWIRQKEDELSRQMVLQATGDKQMVIGVRFLQAWLTEEDLQQLETTGHTPMMGGGTGPVPARLTDGWQWRYRSDWRRSWRMLSMRLADQTQTEEDWYSDTMHQTKRDERWVLALYFHHAWLSDERRLMVQSEDLVVHRTPRLKGDYVKSLNSLLQTNRTT